MCLEVCDVLNESKFPGGVFSEIVIVMYKRKAVDKATLCNPSIQLNFSSFL